MASRLLVRELARSSSSTHIQRIQLRTALTRYGKARPIERILFDHKRFINIATRHRQQTISGTYSTDASIPSPTPSSPAHPLTHDTATLELRQLLSKYFPIDSMPFAATYGSAAFAQLTEEEAKALKSNGPGRRLPPVTEEQPMLDLLFAVDDPVAFHIANIRRNPSHYSFPRLFTLFPSLTHRIQEYSAGVWYNTLIELDDPLSPYNGKKLIKYGVISTSRLEDDLRNWSTLYLAGRMHKPMHILQCTDRLKDASEANLRSALRIATLLLESRTAKAEEKKQAEPIPHPHPIQPPSLDAQPIQVAHAHLLFTLHSLFTVLCSISYAGDIRMSFAENPDKVAKIVVGNWEELVKLYRHPMEDVFGKGYSIQHRIDTIDLPFDMDDRAAMVQQLPNQVQIELRTFMPSASDPIAAFPHLPPTTRHSHLTHALAAIVGRSSAQQTMKGLFTAGVTKCARYTWAKVKKAIKAKGKAKK